LTQLATLAESAKTDFGPTGSGVEEATASIRVRLHSYRRPLLAERVANIYTLLAELEQLGAAETVRLLEQDMYLDLPLSEASERLDNELSYLRGRISEVNRDRHVERARSARQQLRELLADGAAILPERSDVVFGCLRDVADDPDHSATSIDHVAREVLLALGSSQVPVANRATRWLNAAQIVWRGDNSVERIGSIVPALPSALGPIAETTQRRDDRFRNGRGIPERRPRGILASHRELRR
jgi:hypothetical protein